MTNEQLIQTAMHAMRNDTVINKGIVELLCSALAKTAEQRYALVAENASLKRIPKSDSVAMLLALDSLRSESLPDVGLQKAFETLMYHRETPATSSAIAALRAEGVEMFADKTAELGWHESTTHFVRKFARQLRESKGAQS